MIRRLVPWVIGVILILMYAFALVRPIGDLTGLPQLGEQLGLSISPVGWAWLVGAVAAPVLICLGCLWFPRARTAEVRLWILAAGLGTVALLQLEMELLAPLSTFFA